MSVQFSRGFTATVLVAGVIGLGACSSAGTRAPIQRQFEPVEPAAATSTEEDAMAPAVAIPEAAAASFGRALAAMESENYSQAERELQMLALEYPAYAGPFVNLAILHRRQGRDADAEFALQQALEIAPNHPAANNQLGMLYRERGEFAKAEAAYRRALASDPDYALAHYNLGVLLDLYLARTEEALEHYERYRELSDKPGVEVGIWIADLRRRLGLPAEQQPQLAQEDGV